MDDGLIFPDLTPAAPFPGLRAMDVFRQTAPTTKTVARGPPAHSQAFNAKIRQPLSVRGKHGVILLAAESPLVQRCSDLRLSFIDLIGVPAAMTPLKLRRQHANGV